MSKKFLTKQFLLRSAVVSGIAIALAGAASAEIAVVYPGNMGTWSFFNADNTGTACSPGPACATGAMVYGPATPPLGVGSANLQTASLNGDGAAQIKSTALNGTLLNSLLALSYSTYNVSNLPNGQQFPYLKLSVASASANASDQFFFEPPYQTPGTGNSGLPNQGNTAMNTWQTWDAFNGGWWDNNGTCNPGTGVCSLATLVAALGSPSDLTIVGLSLRVGYASPEDNFNGNVDNVIIGTTNGSTTYDFEPVSPAPEPGTLVLFGAGCLALAAAKFKKSR